MTSTTSPSDLTCCTPVHLSDEHYASHDARLRAARAAAEASRPRACPRCGSSSILPTFDPDGAVWGCEDCPNVWTEEESR